MLTVQDSDTAILVASCDAFQDLWTPFFTLFFRHWPDCPYALFLGTNHGSYNHPRLTNIHVGLDSSKASWSVRVRRMLESIPSPYVLLFLEDYLINASVDSERVRGLIRYAREHNAAYLRLFPSPGPDAVCEDNLDVGLIHKGSRYRICTQASWWEKRVLTRLLTEGESVWDFESNGSRRSNDLEQLCLSATRQRGVAGSRMGIVNAPIPYLCTAIVGGKWLRDAVTLCRQEGIEVDTAMRAVEPWRHYFFRVLLPRYPGGKALQAAWCRQRALYRGVRSACIMALRGTRIGKALKRAKFRTRPGSLE